jgi:hypothetical protein
MVEAVDVQRGGTLSEPRIVPKSEGFHIAALAL